MQINSTGIKDILKKVIIYGLPIFYFLIAISFYLRTYDSAQIKITILQMGGLFLIMNWLVLKIEEGDLSFFKNNFIYFLPILLFLASGFLSYLISPFKLTSFNEFTRRFIYTFIAMIVITEFDDEKKLLRIKNWLIAAIYVACIYGILQILDFILYPAPQNPIGMDPFLWRQAFGLRIMSTFGNPNFFGDFLIVMNPIVLAFFMRKKSPHLLILWIMIVINVFFTGSKGAYVGFSVGTIVIAATYVLIFLKGKIKKETLIIIGAAACIFILLASFVVYKKSQQRTDSISFRVFTWMSTWEMINTNPVTGTGIGSFYVTYPAFRRPQIFFIEGKHNTESDHPENEYLEVWFDEGMVGISIFLLLIVFVFALGYKNLLYLDPSKRSRDDDSPDASLAFLQLGVISSFAAKLSHDFVCVSLRFVSSGSVLWLLIGMNIAIAVILAKNIKNKENSAPSAIAGKNKDVLSVGKNLPEKASKDTNLILWTLLVFAVIYFSALLSSGDSMLQVIYYVIHAAGAVLILSCAVGIIVLIAKNIASAPVKALLQLIVAAILLYAMMYFYGYFKADMLHSQAIQLSKAGQFDQALMVYDQVNEYNPSFPMSKYFKANVYIDRWRAGDPIMAERTLKGYEGDPLRGIPATTGLWTIAPNYVQSKYLAGVMYAKMFDDARRLRQEYVKEGKPKEVIDAQDKIVEQNFYNAVRYYKEYMTIDPIYPLTYYGLAKLYESVGDLKDAEAAYYAHLMFPQNLSKPPHNLWVEDRNSPDGGWAKRRVSEYAETYLQLGNFYMTHSKFEAARDAYIKGLALMPTYVVMKKNLALAFNHLGDNKNALVQWGQVYLMDRNDKDAREHTQSAGILKYLDAFLANQSDQAAVNKLLELGILQYNKK